MPSRKWDLALSDSAHGNRIALHET
jgi:hypothetical protein